MNKKPSVAEQFYNYVEDAINTEGIDHLIVQKTKDGEMEVIVIMQKGED
jgi:hypothetical protein